MLAPRDPVEAVAACDDVALELVLGSLVPVAHAWAIAVEVVERDVLDLEVERPAAREPRSDEVLDDLCLAVDDDRLPGELVEGDPMPLASRLQLDAGVDEALAAHPLADARARRAARATPCSRTPARIRASTYVAAPVLEDHRVDPLEVEQVPEREARGARTDDRDLRPAHAGPARSNSAACPCPTPTHIVARP